MANQLKVETQHNINALKAQGWSQRKTARHLGLDRETVRRYWSPTPEPPKPAISTPGILLSVDGPTMAGEVAVGSQDSVPITGPAISKPAISTAGKLGRESLCQALAAQIQAKLESGLTAQRIYQDLRVENSFIGSYQSVKRFVRRLRRAQPQRVWRIEVQPGEEAQVDFGTGATLINADGKRRRTWVFRIVLSYSRKAYSEAVLRQDTETFIRCLENAFRHFGGVTQTLNLDNLKAAVLCFDWADPDFNPKLAAFCRHYGTILFPCKPRTPEHKGKCENSVKYVKSNALKGKKFASLIAENQCLAHWEAHVADLRIHGTTRQQVGQLFAQEKPHLLPLPKDLFPCFKEARRTVHMDSHVEVEKAYYEVPERYIGSDLWVRWDAREVRVFNAQWDQVVLHPRLEPGKFTNPLGIGGGRGPLQANLNYWLGRAMELGEPAGQWAKGLVQQRGAEAIRSLMGLVSLSQRHSFRSLNTACAAALSRGAWRLRDVRQLLQTNAPPQLQLQLPFMEHHPLIRNLAEYGDFIRTHTTQPTLQP